MPNKHQTYQSTTLIPDHAFRDPIAAMYAPLREYVMKVIPLMLEHAWRRKTSNGTTAFDELIYSGWVARLITLDTRVLNREQQNDVLGWSEVRDYLIRCLDECSDKSMLYDMQESCMQCVRPIVESRFENDYRFPERTFHCWWYTVHDDNSNVALHLVNAYQPASPFSHIQHFFTTMRRAVQHARSIHPDIKIVSCGSWLNGLPKFQALWPDSFKQNQTILNEAGGFGPGAWGQYMTTSGGFSEEKASFLTRTGTHPFPLTEGRSPIDEVLAHLNQKILSFSTSDHG